MKHLLTAAPIVMALIGAAHPQLMPGQPKLKINGPVFVVRRNNDEQGMIEGTPTPSLGDLILIGLFDPEPPPPLPPRKSPLELEWSRDPWARYYKPGATYPLFLAGAAAGDVTVEKQLPYECNSSVAVLKQSRVQFGKDTFGLATTASSIRPHAGFQRAPTQPERDAAARIARQLFSKHGVTRPELGGMRVEKILVTRFAPAEAVNSVAAAFTIQGARMMVKRLFFVADLLPPGPRVAIDNYSETNDEPQDVFHEQFIVSFADQADLDGDGVDEFVTRIIGAERQAYVIYKRLGPKWEGVEAGGNSGCY